ncbi:unnamed protein product [Caenorhabditis auriculariae]|uniref:glucuronosyltransferase n=1 Tax=Caenorhabditis auriculariae TaxID=2777116 RepID=A0A8S1HTT3_9PELO|nr:unnamed protein product [Caenorhabditis auriculariae]
MVKTFFFVVFLAVPISGLNFLVYSPLFAHSHTVYLATLADTLTNAGHNVTFFAPLIHSKLRAKLCVKSTKDVILVENDDYMENVQKNIDAVDFGRLWVDPNGARMLLGLAEHFQKMFLRSCKLQLENKIVMESLRSKKFDVIIMEPLTTCAVGIKKYLNIPTMLLAVPLTHMELVSYYLGEPIAPSVYSDQRSEMNLIQRMKNTVSIFLGIQLVKGKMDEEQQLASQLTGLKVPGLVDVIHESPFVFTNSNPLIDYPRPIIHKTVAIGGITVDVEEIRTRKLDQKWDAILNLRPKNVLVSFGSMAKSVLMPPSHKKAIIETFLEFPDVTFIWKYESDDIEFSSSATNVHFTKWVPQVELLADSRLTAFVTHGGVGSTTEFAHLGKPAVMVPVFGDQPRNSYSMERHSNVVVVRKFELADKSVLIDAIGRVINDKTYTENALKLAEMLEKQPNRPKDSFVRHAVFAATFGNMKSLDPYGRQLNFLQYFLIDILLIVVITTGGSLFL